MCISFHIECVTQTAHYVLTCSSFFVLASQTNFKYPSLTLGSAAVLCIRLQVGGVVYPVAWRPRPYACGTVHRRGAHVRHGRTSGSGGGKHRRGTQVCFDLQCVREYWRSDSLLHSYEYSSVCAQVACGREGVSMNGV